MKDEVRSMEDTLEHLGMTQEEIKTELGVGEQLTDTTNAELFTALFGRNVRFDHRRKRWLIWNNNRWEADRTGGIYRLATRTARKRYEWAEKEGDLSLRTKISKHAIASESKTKLESCITLAENLYPIADIGDNWDNDTWLLGVGNGVLDLRTGKFRPGKQGDRITMSTGVDFNPKAECPRWEQFLVEIFEDTELIDWIHRALGYSLLGDTSEQCVFIGYGIGANGKGRFCAALHAALGDYAYSAPFSTFELYQRASIPNDLATLEHKRFVNSSETNDNTRLNEARVKAISGGDRMSARYLHQEYFEFWPHLKLWLFVNCKPKVVDDSFGFWRRVRLIPFIKQFTGKAEDKQLDAKLRAEAPGILAWLVKGCLEWKERGLEPIPDCIRTATQEYQQESDVLGEFIAAKVIEHPGTSTKASELYNAYKQWAEGEGMIGREILTSTAFGRRMKDKYRKERKGGTVSYYDIGIDGQLQDSLEANKGQTPTSSCSKAEGLCTLRTGKETFGCIYEPEECPFIRDNKET